MSDKPNTRCHVCGKTLRQYAVSGCGSVFHHHNRACPRRGAVAMIATDSPWSPAPTAPTPETGDEDG